MSEEIRAERRFASKHSYLSRQENSGQSRKWHLARSCDTVVNVPAGCQGFIGPIPSTFLDKIAVERTEAKICHRICKTKILFRIYIQKHENIN